MTKVRGFQVVEKAYKKFTHNEIQLPVRSTSKSAGYDFFSNEDVEIGPGDEHKFFTDIKAYMLDGEVLKIYVRSSIAIKKHLQLKNQTGIIDCVPKGTLIKTSDGEIEVEKLMYEEKIIISYNEDTKLIEEDKLDEIWVVNYDELYEIETEEGDIVKLPENKEVYTNNGWIKVKNLSLNDLILKY